MVPIFAFLDPGTNCSCPSTALRNHIIAMLSGWKPALGVMYPGVYKGEKNEAHE